LQYVQNNFRFKKVSTIYAGTMNTNIIIMMCGAAATAAAGNKEQQ
jgi:hypothetical protein